MRLTLAVAVTAMVVAATATLGSTIASAEPVVPQPDTPCAAEMAGALTKLPDYKTVLECRNNQWQIFDSPFPNSDRWLSYGPELTLSGEGVRNREIDSGDWIAHPQDSGSPPSVWHSSVHIERMVAGRRVSCGVLDQGGLVGRADIGRTRATRVETAAGRRIDRAWHVALEHQPLARGV